MFPASPCHRSSAEASEHHHRHPCPGVRLSSAASVNPAATAAAAAWGVKEKVSSSTGAASLPWGSSPQDMTSSATEGYPKNPYTGTPACKPPLMSLMQSTQRNVGFMGLLPSGHERREGGGGGGGYGAGVGVGEEEEDAGVMQVEVKEVGGACGVGRQRA